MPLDNPLELLKLCDLAKQWPNLKGLHDLTMKKLEQASKEAEKQLAKEREDEAMAAQQEQLKRQARIDADNKAQEKVAPNRSTFSEFGKSKEKVDE